MPEIPMTSKQVLDRHFLEVRCKLLEIAASLDRMDRAEASNAVRKDLRRIRINRALEILAEPEGDRAERLQILFSREYDSNWMADLEEWKAASK